MNEYVLEPPAAEFADAASHLPPLYELAPTEARMSLEDSQSGPVAKPDVDSTWMNQTAAASAAIAQAIDVLKRALKSSSRQNEPESDFGSREPTLTPNGARQHGAITEEATR